MQTNPMHCKIVRLNHEHLDRLGVNNPELRQAWFSDGSLSYCLMCDSLPVFAGGVVNMQWRRGEAWLLPTPWFRSHIKTCLRKMRDVLPVLAIEGNFKRIQVTCAITVSPLLFRHLGFCSEGVLKAFGPNGETCHLYARLF